MQMERIVAGLVGYVAYVPMSQSLLSVPAAIISGTNMMSAVIVIAVSFIASFTFTYLWGVNNEENLATESQSIVNPSTVNQI